MPPWPARLLSGSSNSITSTAAPAHRDGLLPSPPAQPHVAGDRPPPPANNGRRVTSSPSRSDSARGRPHAHNRSVSHPLPRLFGKKKSSGNLQGISDSDVPLDDALVPVLDEPAPARTPTKVVHGKSRADDDSHATRHCMCCDSKVRFPRDLKVFRCTSCLTVNDLQPFRPRLRDEEGSKSGERKAGTYPGASAADKVILPLSTERTRAIINRCLVTYLEARSRAQQTASQNAEPPSGSASADCTSRSRDSGKAIEASNTSEESPQAPIAQSPEESPTLLPQTSATIRDVADFDQLYLYGAGGTPLASPIKSDNATPGTSGPPPKVPPRSTRRAPIRRPPPPPPGQPRMRPPSMALRGSANTPPTDRPPEVGSTDHRSAEEQRRYDRVKTIFKPLEDYIIASFGDYECLNTSFSTARPGATGRTHSESFIKASPREPENPSSPSPVDYMSELDAKTLLLGDFAENGMWWTGRVERNKSERFDQKRKNPHRTESAFVWYDLVHNAGRHWQREMDKLKPSEEESANDNPKSAEDAKEIDAEIADARQHVQRTLLKVTENVLKRPTRPLTDPDNIRFLLIVLANPSLYPHAVNERNKSSGHPSTPPIRPSSSRQDDPRTAMATNGTSPRKSPAVIGRDPGQHTGILKRIFGLLAYSSGLCHRYLISWFGRLSDGRFTDIVDLVGGFVTYRLSRPRARPRSKSQANDGGLIPDLSGSARNTFNQLHAATGLGGSTKKLEDPAQTVVDYNETEHGYDLRAARAVSTGSPGRMVRPRAKMHGQILPTSDFYNTLLDYHDLIADFKAWESRKAKFAFCQYPFFLSMGSKIRIMEYDARRQMELKAREAYFDQVTTHRGAGDGHFHLRVRRDCMVDDSLRQISEAVGADQEELKKGLRVHFTGEEGVDAGGLRKEWFLMLVRDIFDPNHGMFLYDDDSQTCYFNPNSFETSDQYYLVGALLGLAIYNSTILDVALPPFAFRKLLAAAPTSASNPALTASGSRGQMTYTLEDLAEYRPALAAGLRQLLEFDGDVESTFCRDFVAPVERYGTVVDVPLCPNGAKTPVTSANRAEFVDLYIRYLLDGSVARQFEPFKRGFFTEIELLVRGSDEALDVDSLRAVAQYDNWRSPTPPHGPAPDPAVAPVVRWFWDAFREAAPRSREGSSASDRIPATGAANLVLRIQAGGHGTGRADDALKERFPIARTCFNTLVLWPYESRGKLEEKLWRAVAESEGFGLK
ncbi:putative E3 ubiquitin-protein ligase [Taxawa tesnikishii (nom. ined.)]|nr:putative E3 ubiquitin-protein ligase [Dothideales sp. JES 119]